VSRWTRMCFCGQETAEGPIASSGALGLAEFTGSEEGRGPLFDVTRVPFEGQHLPAGAGPQGDKIGAPIQSDVPTAVPLLAIRVADRMIVSVPGEMTVEMGRRLRAAVLRATGPGIATAIISGLANEYTSYFTTPEEYDQQHYEGAATIYGRTSSVALAEALSKLAGTLVANQPAPPAHPFDPVNGATPDAAPFSTGAHSATVAAQPAAASPLGNAVFSWRGGERGFDRPLDRAFVSVQRRVTIRVPVRAAPRRRGGGRRSGPSFTGRVVAARTRTVRRWVTEDSDLGLQMIWTVDGDGRYTARWELPLGAKPGAHRFVVTANHYRLVSATFGVSPARFAAEPLPSAGGAIAVQLVYPAAVSHQQVGDPPGDFGADLAFRSPVAQSGTARFLVNGHAVDVKGSGGRFVVTAPAGARVELRAGALRDRFGNSNRNALSFGP
ncbi:MAG: neutral ceramidase, partial [Thermoleophilaceae bacterium]|nr:neutral ceramidase [Thermoleophilaceae bacterium]